MLDLTERFQCYYETLASYPLWRISMIIILNTNERTIVRSRAYLKS